MREIKFRGKRLDNGEQVEGHYFTTPLTAEFNVKPENGTFFDIMRDEHRHCISNEDGVVFEVDPATVGQYTGLKDKNGKDIYEGDVLNGTSYLYGYNLENGEQFDYCGFVEWGSQCNVGLCWFLTDLANSGSWELRQTIHRNAIDFSTGEIIGNIFDNPELLKNK